MIAAAKAEELFESEASRYRELLPKVQERRDTEAREIALIEARAGSTITDEPHMKPWKYAILLFLFSIAESSFSIPSLVWSNLGTTTEEIVLAVMAAILLVLACHLLGRDCRRFPLAPQTSVARWAVVLVRTFLEASIVIGGIFTITFFRWKGMQEQGGGETHAGIEIITWALFALGCAFAFTAVLAAYETEFSGARFGLAAHQRHYWLYNDLAIALLEAQQNIINRRQNFRQLLTEGVAALRALHLKKYIERCSSQSYRLDRLVMRRER